MSDQWHLMQEGQKYGPYRGEQLVQFVQEGRIVRETLVWTEGLEDWVAASAVEGLFPPAPAPVPDTWAPPGARRAPMTAHGVAPRGAVAGRVAGHAQRQPADGTYPVLDSRPASFGMVAGFIGGGFALELLAAGILLSGIIRQGGGEQGAAAQVLMVMALLGIGVACVVTGAIVSYVYLARLWSYLRPGGARTTPGMAVGLLFVPFFNLYWIFVAFYGLAQDWNRITRSFADLNHAPRMSEGLVLAWCICSIVAFPVGLILWFPMMAQICRSINFMAYRPVRRPGMLLFG